MKRVPMIVALLALLVAVILMVTAHPAGVDDPGVQAPWSAP